MQKQIRIRHPAKIVLEAKEMVAVKLHGVETMEEKTAEIKELSANPAYVEVGAGVTRKLDDFEFLRLDVKLSMPCNREEVEATQKIISERVADMLAREIELYIPSNPKAKTTKKP